MNFILEGKICFTETEWKCKTSLLFTKLGGLVVESLVFYIGIYTPRPTYLRGKIRLRGVYLGFGHFASYFDINPHNLPNWTKLCTIQLYNLP